MQIKVSKIDSSVEVKSNPMTELCNEKVSMGSQERSSPAASLPGSRGGMLIWLSGGHQSAWEVNTVPRTAVRRAGLPPQAPCTPGRPGSFRCSCCASPPLIRDARARVWLVVTVGKDLFRTELIRIM